MGVYGFAAWFVDRRISCMTNLAVDEIIMNNAVLPYTSSREPSVHLEVTSLTSKEDWGPDSEHVVKFVIPPDLKARGTLSDVQFVLEISGAKSYIPAKFTTAPMNGGGIGCEGHRSHGKAAAVATTATDESAYAIFTINSDANMGSMIKIVGGWAIGHEAVTLTESIIMFVGHGIATNDENDDDGLIDDQAEVELEEEYIEEERQELVGEIDNAEEDAVMALEEKREEIISNQSEGSEVVDVAEEKIVEMLEVEREDVNYALDALKDEIESQKEEQKERNKELQKQHAIHTEEQRQESQRLHRIEHNRKNSEDKLQELRRRFDKDTTASSNKDNNNNNKHDASAQARLDKLDQVMDLRGALKDSVKKLNLMDKKEHDHIYKEHISQPTKERLNEMIVKVKQKMHIASEKLGVNELIHNNNHAVGSMSERRMGGGDAGYHGDVGKPLHPLARIILQSIFGLVGLCGLVSYYLDKRRKAMKGRRNL